MVVCALTLIASLFYDINAWFNDVPIVDDTIIFFFSKDQDGGGFHNASGFLTQVNTAIWFVLCDKIFVEPMYIGEQILDTVLNAAWFFRHTHAQYHKGEKVQHDERCHNWLFIFYFVSACMRMQLVQNPSSCWMENRTLDSVNTIFNNVPFLK